MLPFLSHTPKIPKQCFATIQSYEQCQLGLVSMFMSPCSLKHRQYDWFHAPHNISKYVVWYFIHVNPYYVPFYPHNMVWFIFPLSSHHIQYSHDIPTFFSQHFGGLAHHIVAFFQLEIPRWNPPVWGLACYLSSVNCTLAGFGSADENRWNPWDNT